MKSIGIDLAGKEENSTGFTAIHGSNVKTCILNSNEDIIDACIAEGSDIIAIDAPLSFSKGGGFRKSDYELINKGYRVLPPDFDGMECLTERGKNISKILSKNDFEVIEVHPRTSGEILFDSDIREEWVLELSDFGYDLDTKLSEHEIDSLIAAINGKLYLENKTEQVGKRKKGIIIPCSRLGNLG